MGAVACPECGQHLNQDGWVLRCGCPTGKRAPVIVAGTVRRPDGRHKSRVEFGMLRKSHVPEGGWTSERFGTPHGAALLHDIYAGRNAVLVPAIARFSVFMRGLLQQQCRDAVDIFVDLVGRQHHRSAKAALTVEFNLEWLGPVWELAIADALQKAGAEVSIHAKPAMQSVASAVHERTSILIGAQADAPHAQQEIARRTNAMASQVTRINETTRARLVNLLEASHNEHDTIADTVQEMRHRIPEIAANRAPTIARTELGRASDVGMIRAYQDCETLTHVSVIGCEAIEPNIPEWHGIPTCNIQNVPAAHAHELEFHINHTGCIVPSQFRDEHGRVPNVPASQGTGDHAIANPLRL